jgi:diguanylate cyclase (GGDEF)-like protein/PAS domain S-box-containing protein
VSSSPDPSHRSTADAPPGAHQRFENLVNCIDGIVWEADPATFQFTFVSAQAEHILGYRIEDWYAEGFWAAHIHPQERERAIDYCVTQTRGGNNHAFEYRMLAADGRVVWLKDAVSVGVRAGQAVSLCGIMVDITERQQLAEALQEKNSLLQKVIDNIPCGISMIDADLNIILINRRAQAILDVPDAIFQADSTPLEHVLRFNAERGEYGPGDPDAQVTARLERTRLYQPHLMERIHPDGTVIEVRGVPLADGGFITTYTDITELELAEQALRMSATVFESSTEGIVITDAATRILKVNRTFCAITGYAADEALGQTPALLQSGRQDAAFYQAMWQSITEHGHWSGEIWNRRKSGEVFIERLSISQVHDAIGAVTNYIGIFSDISHAKAAQSQIERLSYFDALTNLPNRALLQDRLQHALLNAERKNRRVALLTIDIDRLGHINDTLGHHVGDQVIVVVAERLVASVRTVDTVSRHLGDEFAVILEDLDDSQTAAHMAERMLAALGEVFRLEEHEISVSACIGISIFPDDGKTPLMLLKNADVALHHAKGSGSFQFFREEMNAASMERMLIESSLRLALRRNEFRVFYQAQLDFASGQIIGMEALVRWAHPEMGLVAPMRFIPVAEETGQIVDIGLWVLRAACQETRRWHDLGYDHLRVAVNVSAKQFNQDDFAAQVKRILQDTGLAPERLELELTESLIMQRPERVIGTMEELRALGVKFSIDDFGTGYSSLSQLKRFPIDKLKIDQSFTRDIGTDANSTAITRAIIALGTSMHLQVVAEGVETDEQQRFLIDNGCHSMQGYLFSRPIPADDFLCLLVTHSASLDCVDTLN